MWRGLDRAIPRARVRRVLAELKAERRARRAAHARDARVSTTVLAPTAADADALATAFFVMGVEATMEYCRTRDELAAVLICEGTRRGMLEIHQIGLQPDEWQELPVG